METRTQPSRENVELENLGRINDLARQIAGLFRDDDPVLSVMILRKAAQLIESQAKNRKG